MTATEAEELAKKIIRAEWAIIKGWVPEIVANEVAGQLCEAIRPILSEQAQQLAALRAEVAAKDKQLHCMELRAKSAEAIAGVPGVDITRPACDCCEHSGPTVQYHDAAGYLCDKCEPKVMSARESVTRHLQREAELEAEVARLTAEVERWQSAASGYATDNAEMSHQLAEKTAEVERMQCVSNVACSSNGHYQRVNDNLRQQLAVTTERLAAAERLFVAFAQYGTSNGNPARMRITDTLFAMYQPAWDGAEQGWYLINYPNPVAKNGPHPSPVDVVLEAIAQGWLPAGEAKGVQS